MSNFTKRSNRRLINNVFHLNTTLEDTLYSSPSFVIEEEIGEIIRFKKTKVTFNPIHSTIPSCWFTPEIDTIDFVFQSTRSNLFIYLLEQGFDSFFIRLFAENERYGVPFKDPEFNTRLIKKTTAKLSKEDEIIHYFHLDGGSLHFHRILEKDPQFWLEMMRACRETDIVKIFKFHLCADTNRNLMPFISNAIKKGHYESSGLQARAYYSLAGHYHNGSIGKSSKVYDVLKDSEFKIETLYFGHDRQALSFIFYDKEKEQLERKGSFSAAKTRIEVRFNSLAGADIPHEIFESLIRSYFNSEGTGFRIRVFLHFLNNCIRFTDHFTSSDPREMSNWWKHNVIIPLYHAGLAIYKEDINDFLTGNRLFPLKNNQKLLTVNSPKRKRGRPAGKKDSKPRKCKSRSLVIDITPDEN